MDANKIKEVVAFYREFFERGSYPKKRFAGKSSPSSEKEMFSHCHYMLDEIETFIANGGKEKAFRWLGFIQGCLWTRQIYTIEDLRNHNRPR